MVRSPTHRTPTHCTRADGPEKAAVEIAVTPRALSGIATLRLVLDPQRRVAGLLFHLMRGKPLQGDGSMTTRHWLRKLFGVASPRLTTTRKQPRQRYRPLLEILEGRLVPAGGSFNPLVFGPAS